MTQPTAPAPQRRGPNWLAIIGGCCGCLVLLTIISIAGFFLFIRGALQATPLPPSQSAYVGSWTGSDGTSMVILSDGHGGYQSGSQSVKGGAVKIDETAKSLEIGLFGMKKMWHIDEAPHDTGSGKEMKLDGVTFTQPGSSSGPSGGNTPDSGTTPGGGTEAPALADVETLVKESLLTFNRSVQAGDFTELYNSVHPALQQSTTADGLKSTFHEFVDKHIDFSEIGSMSPVWEETPSINSAGALTAKGHFPTTPSQTDFDLDYQRDSGTWKLVRIHIKHGD